jgi:hypothetical protein
MCLEIPFSRCTLKRCKNYHNAYIILIKGNQWTSSMDKGDHGFYLGPMDMFWCSYS